MSNDKENLPPPPELRRQTAQDFNVHGVSDQHDDELRGQGIEIPFGPYEEEDFPDSEGEEPVEYDSDDEEIVPAAA